MKFKKILVPVDSSEASMRAFNVAVDMAHDTPDCTIHAVCVIPSDDMPNWMGTSMDSIGMGGFTPMIDQATYREILDKAIERDTKRLQEILEDSMGDMKDRVTVGAISSGSISAGIVSYAEDNECDMIVMGSRGLGKVRSILGSVSYGVLHEVNIPVTIVK